MEGLVAIFSGKWPKGNLFGQPQRFEHPDRLGSEPKEKPKDEVPETNAAEILNFFKPT